MQNYFSKNIITYLEENITHNNSNYEKLFESINKNYKPVELIECYAYILENKADLKLLISTIRHMNKTHYFDSMQPLINFIQKDFKSASYNDAKVLAIKAVSYYRNKSCVPVLLYCLNNKTSNYKIRLAAAEALGKIGDKIAFESLSNVVNDEEENSAYIKESAVVALGMLGDERAIDVFDSILHTKKMFLDKFSYLKERIVEAMAKFDISKDKRAIEILKKSLMEPSSRLRISAIEAIQNSQYDGAYDLIYDRLLYDDDLEVKKNALVALYNLSDRRILDEVTKGDFEEELKDYAKYIIEEYEDNDE